jgi:hypothetical protein
MLVTALCWFGSPPVLCAFKHVDSLRKKIVKLIQQPPALDMSGSRTLSLVVALSQSANRQ